MQHWRLLEQVFTVETIMTTRSELVLWNGVEPLAELWHRADSRKVDVIPVLTNDQIRAVLYRDKPEPVELGQDCFVPHNLPIPNALELLSDSSKKPFLLVTFQQTVVGLINPSDFNKLSARTYFYNLLAEMEMEIAKHIRKQFEGKQPDILKILEAKTQPTGDGQKRLQQLRQSIAQMEQDDVEIEFVHLLNLSELVNIVSATTELRNALGFPSPNQVDKQLNGLVHFRNDVMHTVKLILHKDRSLQKLCQQVERTRTLLASWKEAMQ